MDTIETTAVVLFIVASASIFAWVLTTTRVTDAVGTWVLAITDNPLVFLLLANIFLLFVGCFMETIAAITILVPVFMPIIDKLGIDPVHFGVVMVLNLMIGLLTPPVGMVLFVLQKVAQDLVRVDGRSVLPWMIPLLADAAHRHLRADGGAGAAVAAVRQMSPIERVEIFQIDLPPKVVRTDAIQSFVRQETPIVRITCADGAHGHRLRLHHRHRRLVGAGAAARPPAPLLAARTPPRSSGCGTPVLPHPCDRGRRDHLPGAGRDRHRAVGPALPARRAAAVADGRRRAARCAAVHDRGRLAASHAAALVDERWRRRRRACGAPSSRSASRHRRGPGPARRRPRRRRPRLRAHGRRQPVVDGARGDPACARSTRPWISPGSRSRCLPTTWPGTSISPAPTIPIAVGESLYHPAQFREYLERGARSIVQVDAARIGGITPWLKVAHLAEAYNVRSARTS